MLGFVDTGVDSVADEIEDVEGRAETTSLTATGLQVASVRGKLIILLSNPLLLLLSDLIGSHISVILEVPGLLVLAKDIVTGAHSHLFVHAFHILHDLVIEYELHNAEDEGHE